MNIDRFMRIITNDKLQRKFTQRFYYVVWFFLVIFWGYLYVAYSRRRSKRITQMHSRA